MHDHVNDIGKPKKARHHNSNPNPIFIGQILSTLPSL